MTDFVKLYLILIFDKNVCNHLNNCLGILIYTTYMYLEMNLDNIFKINILQVDYLEKFV